ncbi:MAG: glycosyltransferase [Bacteroidia bacterium]|nr:glycosyltransferase [Bacteroidia bacterium]
MGEVKISVCIPVYNGAEFIKVAIDSVLSQTLGDFEIIVVDNQSTDNTLELVKQYSDSRIKIFQNPTNIGMIPNWNKTLEYATGKYIKILPADDLLFPNCLKMQAEVLDADVDKKISLVCSSRHIINDQGKTLFKRGFSGKRMQLSGTEAINKVIRSGGNIIGEGGAVMFRREILAKTGPFNSNIFYVLDLDQWFKILRHGQLVVLPDFLSAFRVSSGSASVQIANKQKDDYFNFIDLVYKTKEYGLTAYSYKLGKVKTFILTEIKKLIYRFVV